MDKVDHRAGELVVQAIKEQIRLKDPPETKETFDRLCRDGHAKEEVYRMLVYRTTNSMF